MPGFLGVLGVCLGMFMHVSKCARGWPPGLQSRMQMMRTRARVSGPLPRGCKAPPVSQGVAGSWCVKQCADGECKEWWLLCQAQIWAAIVGMHAK